MSVWTSATTAGGLALVAGAAGHTLNFTRVACGDAATTADLSTLTALPNYKIDLSITEITASGSTGTVRAQLNTEAVGTAFNLYLLGLYARLDDGDEVLYKVMQRSPALPIPGSSETPNTVVDFKIDMPVGNASSITATIDAAALVTVGMISEVAYSTPETVTAPVIELPSTVQESPLVAVLSGRTKTNIAEFAGCESTDGWTLSNVSIVTDSSNQYEGTNCIKITVSSGQVTGGPRYDILSILDTVKYYLITAYVKNGDASNGIKLRMRSDDVSVESDYSTSTSYTRLGIVIQPSDIDTATYAQVNPFIGGTESQYAYFDAICIEEITAAEYALGASVLLASGEFNYVGYGTQNAGPQRLVSVGKNPFDKNKATIGYEVNYTSGGIVISSTSFTSEYVPIKESTSYTFSWQSGSGDVKIEYLDNNKNFISGARISTVNSYGTRTTPSNAKYLRFSSSLTLIDVTQLELGSTATPYVPYSESVAYVPAPGNSLPNGAADEIDLLTGKKTQNVSDWVTFDGNEGWSTVALADTTTNIGFALSLANFKNSNTLCLYSAEFKTYTSTELYSGNYEGISSYGYWGSAQKIVVAIAKSKLTTMDMAGFLAWLAENPITIIYQFAEPIVTDLDGLESVMACPSGAVYISPGIEFTAKPSDGVLTIPDTDYPIVSVESVEKLENGSTITPDSFDGTTVTLPEGYDDDAFYRTRYLYAGLLPSITYSYAMNIKAQLATTVTTLKEAQKDIADIADLLIALAYDIDTRAAVAVCQVKTGTGTLTAASWALASGVYSQSVVDADITADMQVDVTISDADLPDAVMGAAKVTAYAGGFTVKCTIQPSADLGIAYIARKVGM